MAGSWVRRTVVSIGAAGVAAAAVVAVVLAAGSGDGTTDRSDPSASAAPAAPASAPAGTAGTTSVVSGAPSDAPDGAPAADPSVFREAFDGAPTSPTPWSSDSWEVTVHSRDTDTFDSLQQMDAAHGADCAGPPATHPVSDYADAVFQCRDHVMTSLYAEGYGVVYLTPDHLVDFSDGEAVISFRVSTARTSLRDWWDVWISPYGTSLQLPLESWLPDLSGPPRDAVAIGLGDRNQLQASVYRDFEALDFPGAAEGRVPGDDATGYDAFLTPDPARRDLVEIRISRTHLRVGMPEYGVWWIDAALPDLGWDQGVVQFGHHSYNPLKDCAIAAGCSPNTWHWDDVTIEPAVPFTILHGDRTRLDASNPVLVLDGPAPEGAHLRFAGIGRDLEISTDGGDTWFAAEPADQSVDTPEEHFASYWTPIPAGTSDVQIRGTDWFAGTWIARSLSVWAPATS